MADPVAHNDSPPARSCRERIGRALALAAALGLGAVPAAAQDEEAGRFEILEASGHLADGVYYVDASIGLALSADAREALESGLTLTIRLEVELLNRRPLWVDTTAASVTQLYALEYHALTERFIVRHLNLERGDQAFAMLDAALDYIGRVEELPFIDAALLDSGQDVRVRVLLDTEQLPGPLRLLAFWRRDWSLGSEWHRWRLPDD